MSSLLSRETFAEVNAYHSPRGERGRSVANRYRAVRWPVDKAKPRVLEQIYGLPESAIKTQLQARVVPNLTQEPPFTRSIAGIDLPVLSVDVGFQYKPIGENGMGHFTYLKPGAGTTHVVEAAQVATIPLVIGITDAQRRRFPDSLLPDGTLVIDIDFPKGRELLIGLSPQIQIIRSINLAPGKLGEYYDLERFIMVKEACNWLVDDSLLEETLKNMQENALKSTLLLRKKGQKVIEQVELGMNVLKSIKNLAGRTQALTDLASYFLAFQAIRRTAYFDNVAALSGFGAVIDEVGDVDYGTSAADLLYNSSEKVMAIGSASGLHHIGDMSKIP